MIDGMMVTEQIYNHYATHMHLTFQMYSTRKEIASRLNLPEISKIIPERFKKKPISSGIKTLLGTLNKKKRTPKKLKIKKMSSLTSKNDEETKDNEENEENDENDENEENEENEDYLSEIETCESSEDDSKSKKKTSIKKPNLKRSKLIMRQSNENEKEISDDENKRKKKRRVK